MVDFTNPVGFYAFLALIPLIILYLIRPRPKEMVIPSLMFLMEERGITRQSNFLRRILRDLLFLIHLLALIGLAFALTNPMVNLPYDAASEATVVLLDVSASMQTQDGLKTRFSRAVDVAKDNLQGSTSIILIENTPVIVLEDTNKFRASTFLSTLEAKATASNVGDAMLLAGDLMEGEGRVLVVSDFQYTDGPDPEVAKKVLESKGAVVDFIDVSNRNVDNVGIVDIAIDKFKTKVYVKNFNDQEKTVTVRVTNNKKPLDEKPIPMLTHSIETFTFDTLDGITTIEILDKDSLEADNIAYIAAPNATKVKVLMVANNPNSFLKNALLSSGHVEVEVVEPPLSTAQIQAFDHPIIVFSNFTKDWIPAADFKEFYEKAEKEGRTIIITAQQNMDKIDFAGLLPVKLGTREGLTTILPTVVNQITKDVDFSPVSKHFSAQPLNDSLVLASAADNTPMVVMRDIGVGRVIYYGMMDDHSDFKYSPSYPIFWSEVIDYITGIEDINNFNYKSGRVITFPEETWVRTPSTRLKTKKLLLDEVGLYEAQGRVFAANLLNEKESDILAEKKVKAERVEQYEPEKVKKRKDVSFESYFLFGVFALLLLELLYIKRRGDL